MKKAGTAKSTKTAKKAASKSVRPTVEKSAASKPTAHAYIRFTRPRVTVKYGSEVSVSAYVYRRVNDVPIQIPLVLIAGDKHYPSLVPDRFGYASWIVKTLGKLKAGDHEIQAVFDGDDEFFPCERACSLTVYRANSALIAEVEATGKDRYELRAILKGEAGEPIAKREVQFIVNGTLRGTEKTDAKGIARHRYSPSASGNKLNVRFDGDENYSGSRARNVF